jgi:hypothetical protein
MPDTTRCGQPGCGATVVWGRTVRRLDERTKLMVGGKAMMVDWPLPDPSTPTRVEGDGSSPVPNLGVHGDDLGSFWIRVVTADEPLRADERPAVPHWATCANPPRREPRRPRTPRAKQAREGQDALFPADAPTPPNNRPSLLSDANLFPRRRRG